MSEARSQFEASARAKDWANAYMFLNGLNMDEMLKALAGLTTPALEELYNQRTSYTGRFGIPRIEYAVDVVRGHRLPLTAPGDLEATGQTDTAWTFLTTRPVDDTSNPAMGAITLTQLRHVMPHLPAARAGEYLPFLNAAMAGAGIDTRLRQAAYLAQIAHESVELRYMEEIASGAAYERRGDLGNTQAGDGVRYKGRGPIQLTGRGNYRAAGTDLNLDLEANPEQVATPQVGFRVSGWFWTRRGLNVLADGNHFREITRRINGGYNGMASREAFYHRALHAF